MSHDVSLRARRAPRPDKAQRSTRERLLETAGEVFAEQGFDRATGKEICAKAGANVAAINYHFGSFDGLYAAVLEEAQRRFITYDALAAVVAEKKDAQSQLRALVGLAVERLTSSDSRGWPMRVIAREMAVPSPPFMALRQKEIQARAALIKSMVSQILKLPPEHPAVARAALSIIAPFAMLSIADRAILHRAFPALALEEDGAEALAGHFYAWAMAGLAAVRRSAKRKR